MSQPMTNLEKAQKWVDEKHPSYNLGFRESIKEAFIAGLESREPVEWNQLRDKFFRDLTRNSVAPDFNCMPHNVFEWIKANVPVQQIKDPDNSAKSVVGFLELIHIHLDLDKRILLANALLPESSKDQPGKQEVFHSDYLAEQTMKEFLDDLIQQGYHIDAIGDGVVVATKIK